MIAPKGTPVKATEAGEIVSRLVGKQGGKTIWLRGVSGLTHRFLHLDTYAVKMNQQVAEGDILGTVGSTGSLSTGAHLHWDTSTIYPVNPNSKAGFIDPMKWLKSEVNMDKQLAEKLIREVVYGYPAGGALNRQTDPAVDDKPAFDSRVRRLMAASDWSQDLANQVEEAVKSPEFREVRIGVI